ncbi:MAG: sigma 54-interacting transcriptional regulator [Myxococcota bacterium]
MSAKPRILFVDDDADLRRLLALRLASAGYAVETASSGVEALGRTADFQPDLVVTDVRMDGMDGMQLFDALRRRNPTLPVVMLTAHGSIPDAVEATQKGVFGYLTKPFDSQALLDCVRQALEVSGGAGDDSGGDEWRRDLLTRSPKMEEVLRRARLVADSDASVLVLGESGTGKELLAKAIHRASRRRDRAFVAVNCAAIPEALLESELFGHRRGAFTGATVDHTGLVESADGGTLFLDEIGDMPLPLQAKLLRTLQEREVRPVGATKTIPVDVRVLSATHADLERDVEGGRFRGDLLYRLNVVTLRLPPLAERCEDIPLLASRFLQDLAAREGRPTRAFAPEALELLVGARWPGNVRQLHNVVEQCTALATTAVIPADLVMEALRDRRATLPTLDEARSEAERDYLVRLLRITRGNVTHAARLAGRNRTEFYKLLSRHALEPERYRDPDDVS